MATLTVDMPDPVAVGLQQIAATRDVAIDTIVTEMAVSLIEQVEAEQRFLRRAARGNSQRGLDLLDKVTTAPLFE
ncbi:MAG: toxin-antitoxin system HicB family antitoxin [Magnetococcales bacterium]|nr:toxin-antitoxin system HicB family antitoxin [Magnetococcales bacterium]